MIVTKTIASTAAAGSGAASVVLLGDLALFNVQGWGLLLGIIFGALLSSNLLRHGVLETREGVSDVEIRRARWRTATMFLSQFMLGVGIAILLGRENMVFLIPAILVIGYSGLDVFDLLKATAKMALKVWRRAWNINP